MRMALLRWQARILNQIYKTQRYDKLTALKLNKVQELDYSIFFQMTPGVDPSHYAKIIEASNKLCRPETLALEMQKQVVFLEQYIAKYYHSDAKQNKLQPQVETNSVENVGQPSTAGINFGIEHVVLYSTLSKCRIWPKVLKTGVGLVPNLINFYNSFTKQYKDWLDFKFDPVILTQKYTKIMKKANIRKRDHPQLIKAVKENNLQEVKVIVESILQATKPKVKKQESFQQQFPSQNKEQQQQFDSLAGSLNNIMHQNMSLGHIVAQYGDVPLIKYFQQAGVNFQALDHQKQTPIFYAVKRANMEIIKYLVEQVKVNLNHREYQDRSLIYLASFEGEIDVVHYLYQNGANPDLSSKLDRTPLSKACYLGNVPVVKYLISIKVDITKKDNKGRTALHNAAWGIEGGREGKRRGHIRLQDSPECVELLLEAGHPIDVEDDDGFTALFSAVSSMAIRSMQLLISRGANLDHLTKNHQNAVFIAAKYGHLPVLQTLIHKYYLSFITPDIHGYTALGASITLQSAQTFYFLADLHVLRQQKINIVKIIECCARFTTIENVQYVEKWIESKGQYTLEIDKEQRNRVSARDRVAFLVRELPELIDMLKISKLEIRELRDRLARIKDRHRPDEDEKTEKKVYKTQEEHKEIKMKEEQILSKVQENQKKFNMLLHLCCRAIAIFQKTASSETKPDAKQYKLEAFQSKKQPSSSQQVTSLRGSSLHLPLNQQKQVLTWLLSEVVAKFNSDRGHSFKNIASIMIDLALLIDPIAPCIPPSAPVPPLQLHHFTPTPQVLALLHHPRLRTNLTATPAALSATLFLLVKLRKTEVLFSILNSPTGYGGHSHEQLIDIISSTPVDTPHSNNQAQQQPGVNLVQYCLMHGIADMATYLQQLCKGKQHCLRAVIPAYQTITDHKQVQDIGLEPVDAWVLDIEAIAARMSARELQTYEQYFKDWMRMEDTIKQDRSIFVSCFQYTLVDTLPLLRQMRAQLQSSILIGIDVEYYSVSKQQSFICSIQISVGTRVFLIDTLSHLLQQHCDTIDVLTPAHIGECMGWLMADPGKIKIYHSYENDIRWLQEGYGLGACCNVVDTNKMYEYCFSKKKNISVGLKTLCKDYLNYHMKKDYQRSDWRIRPLFEEMVAYAVLDAEVLPHLYLRLLGLVQEGKKQQLRGGFCAPRRVKCRGVRTQLLKPGHKLHTKGIEESA